MNRWEDKDPWSLFPLQLTWRFPGFSNSQVNRWAHVDLGVWKQWKLHNCCSGSAVTMIISSFSKNAALQLLTLDIMKYSLNQNRLSLWFSSLGDHLFYNEDLNQADGCLHTEIPVGTRTRIHITVLIIRLYSNFNALMNILLWNVKWNRITEGMEECTYLKYKSSYISQES